MFTPPPLTLSRVPAGATHLLIIKGSSEYTYLFTTDQVAQAVSGLPAQIRLTRQHEVPLAPSIEVRPLTDLDLSDVFTWDHHLLSQAMRRYGLLSPARAPGGSWTTN